MFSRKIFNNKNTRSCVCSNLKQSDIIEPKPKSSLSSLEKNPSRPIVPSSSSSSSNSFEKANSTTTSSKTCSDNDLLCSKLRGAVAIMKDSRDPFLDFRHSMMEMICVSGIDSKDELRELLDLFLELNSVCHHGAIVKAFMEIWNAAFPREACESIQLDPVNMHGGH